MKKKYTVSYSRREETITAKIRRCLDLPLMERYKRIIGLGEFLYAARKEKDLKDARRSFKTVQILKSK